MIGQRKANTATVNRVSAGAAVLSVVWLIFTASVSAQSSSLYQRGMIETPEFPHRLGNSSWTFRKLPSPLRIEANSRITIRVDEKAQTFSEGGIERRSVKSIDLLLQDWIRLVGINAIKPSPQNDGDQRVRGSSNTLNRSEGELETRESLKFDITARVADVRPNGNLVLEAHRTIRINEEVWEYSLSGTCRRQDIQPGNVLFSKNIADLKIYKEEKGIVRDSYRRGWLLKLRDTFRWF